ncbi:MAG: HEPN domain-containing protein [Fimbriimonadia bacterium]|nr:HEPN domain-containing protein [Fimbriimonadia bacterium]
MPSSHTLQWLAKADEDIRVVELLHEAGGPWSMATYHLQQAAEKHIKAVLVELGIAPPKTHDLVRLLGLFPGTPPPQPVESAAALIGVYAWLTRYPGYPPIDETHFLNVQKEFEVIREWALKEIPVTNNP